METKREAKYTKWVDFYNNHFKIVLNNFKTSVETVPNDKKIELINEVYTSAIDTLRIYLRNNGLFKETNLDVIKECFYIDFIEDGEDWIEIFELIENSDEIPTDPDFITKCINTFNRLDKKFIGAIEDNDC